MLVDIHGHIGFTAPSAAPPARLAVYAGACDVDYVLVSNRDAGEAVPGVSGQDEYDANVACLKACAGHPRLRPLYWVRPGRADSNVHAVVGALQTEPFVGVVFSPGDMGFDASGAILDPYLSALAGTACPVLFCTGGDEGASPTNIYETARRHPQVPIVLCRCGLATAHRASALDVVSQAVSRHNANLYLDTSHASVEEICMAVRVVGAERVLFGTDAPSYADAHIPRHIALLSELRQALDTDVQRRLFGGNAAQLFGLTPPGPT